MGVPVLALFRKNKIRESQYYCHSRNLNLSKFMSYTVLSYSKMYTSVSQSPEESVQHNVRKYCLLL